MHLLQVLQLGVIDYSTALKLQQTLVSLRKQNRIADTLLLLEHPPVITLGRNSKTTNILASPESLAQRGVEVHETDRGGDVTLHAPGQLVGYPICDLRGFTPKVGAVDFVRKLEETLVRACADFGIATERVPGCTGVWTQAASSDATCAADRRKIAAIGIHISRGITSHGFALNVDNDLGLFKLIIPCGIPIEDKPVTSMAAELGEEKPPTIEAVSQSLTRQFGNVFGTQILWLESLDSLLSSAAQPGQDQETSHNQDIPLREPDDLRRLRDELDISPRDDIHWA